MNAWDRRTDETDKAWIGFVAYRDQGPGRTLPRAMTISGAKPGAVRAWERWSSRFDWVARAQAFDGHVDRKSVQPAVEKARAEMAERHVRLGKALQGIAAQALPHLNEKAKAGKLKAGEVAALTKSGVDVERVASGEPTEIQRLTLVDEGRDRLRRIFGDDEVKA